jgi:endonuclease/exonuclease/phosphatase family metal-dependent hydrolase
MKEPFYLFINHWKAKSGAESQRIVSARVLRKRIKTLGSDKNIILVGDFNSDYEEYKKFKRIRRLNDTGGKTGINNILRTTLQTMPYSCKMPQVKGAFYNLWYDTDKKKRFSYIFRRKKEAIDNILISQSLLDCKKMHYKKGSISSFQAPYLYNGKKIYRWQIRGKKHPKHTGKGYSDHLAVSAKFIVK